MPTVETFFDSEDRIVESGSPDAIKMIRAEFDDEDRLIKESWFYTDDG